MKKAYMIVKKNGIVTLTTFPFSLISYNLKWHSSSRLYMIFTIPSQVRQSTICSTLPKNLFVELEVPSIRPRALDEISNWYKFHFQALQWQTCLLLKQWFLKWWSMAFDLGFLTLKWSTLRIFLVYPCMKSSRKKPQKIIS